nr:hypothetical protein [Tanacetum cinerariifolium]
MEDDKEQEELKRCLEIISDDGYDATIDATPLSTKSLTIFDYKIYKEGKRVISKFSKQMEIHRWYNAVPPPYTRNFMLPKPNLFYPNLDDFIDKCVSESVVKKPTKTVRKENRAPIIMDWVSECEEEDKPKFQILKVNAVRHKPTTAGLVLMLLRLWTTTKAKNINGEAQMHAKVDGNMVITFEASIRRDLWFGNEGGVDCFSNKVICEKLTPIGNWRRKGCQSHGLKRLYKVGLSARVESSANEAHLNEENACKSVRISNIDSNQDIYLDNVYRDEDIFSVNDQDDTSMFDADKDLQGEEVIVEKAVVDKEESIKKENAGDELEQEKSKKQKVEDDKEQEKLKRCLEIIPDDGDDVTIDATYDNPSISGRYFIVGFLKIVMDNPNSPNEPNEDIPKENPVIPEPNHVEDTHDPNEMVDIPDDEDLVDHDGDDEEPQEEPKEEPEEEPKQ